MLFAQNIISGTVISEDGELLLATNVTITDENKKLQGFAVTNDKGIFSIKLKKEISGLIFLNARRLGYAPHTEQIENKTQTIELILFSESTVLEEVIIESYRPISQRGDTISYHVGSFAEQKDRSIGDVLSKMPGIDVLPDGRVLYQGRPIEKYYIEGMDLLEGKYNLANSNLPHVAVTSVEILENHQPIQVLDSLVSSDRTSLNIRLKKDVTLTGVANVATGVSPLLWEANVTPMLFKKTQQAIVSYQANNTGIDAERELKTLTLQDLMEQMENTTEKSDMLGIVTPAIPNISGKRFLDNNVHMLTGNFLSKLRNQTEVRLNISYLNDYQQQVGGNLTKYFLPQGDVILEESISNRIFNNDLQANLTIHKNTKESFFKNSFKTQLNWDGQHGMIRAGSTTINQYLQNPYYSFSNQLKWVTPIGGQLFTVYSFINYNRTPQQLSVYPGQFTDVLNSGDEYENIRQQTERDVFQTNNYLEHTKKIKNYTIGTKIGFNIASREVNSQLFRDEVLLEDEFRNGQRGKNYKLYLQPNIAYKYNKWDMNFQLPVSYQGVEITNSYLNKIQENEGVVIAPRFSIRYDWDAYWRSSANIGYNNDFQSSESVLFGYLMNNYRTLQISDYPVERRESTTFNFGLNYRNPIKSLFFSTFYLFYHNINPFLFRNVVQDDGTRLLTVLDKENTLYSHNINTKVSKYFSRIKTTLSLGMDIYLQQGDQLVNTVVVNTTNRNLKPNLKINTRFTEIISMDYGLETNFRSNKTKGLQQQNIFSLSENIKFNIYPKSNQYIGVSMEHHYNDFLADNKHNFYADLLYRYTITKSNIDLEFRLMNILNENTYVNSSFSDFYFYQSVFRIRPRQAMLGIKFSF